MQPIFIAGSSVGLEQDKKPFLLPDQAFSVLENAYVWRDRVIKRQGLKLLGRLRRVFNDESLGNSGASVWSFNIYSTLAAPITPETNAEIEPGSVVITISPTDTTGAITGANNSTNCEVQSAGHGLSTGDSITIAGVMGMPEINGGPYVISVVSVNSFTINRNSLTWGKYTGGGTWTHETGGGATFTDNGDGTLTGTPAGNSGTINYITGNVSLTHTAGAGNPTVIDFNYFPGLPVMGILTRDTAPPNDEETIFFDTVYAYIFSGTGFQEYIPGTVWAGTDSDFFSAANYRGSTADVRLFFVTNFVNDAADPIRYTDGQGTWTNFAPLITATDTLFQARILIPYFGRLVAFNTWEGTTAGGYASASNFFNRCRFSQIGNPIQVDAWRSDLFGKGGFIDAPTNEEIISVAFFKNTLIVGFERSTWQLRYVGEYGLPFIWERISSDFGTESTFSTILFDQGVASVGDRAIVISTAVNVQRIDSQIPDIVFSFHNENQGLERVYGIRDYRRELVFWTNNQSQEDSPVSNVFPNNVLVYNYRNNTYAQFRDNVTCFGTYQATVGITWDRLDVFWDDEVVTWDDPTSQSLFPSIVAGNQQGFVHFYGYTTPDDVSLSITAVDLTVTPIQLTIPNHNLFDDEIIYITDLNFVDSITLQPLATDLNNQIYKVEITGTDTVTISKWNFTTKEYEDDFAFTPVTTAVYVGGGKVALFPRLDIQTKDFNPYQNTGHQVKISYIDFLTDATPSSAMTIVLFVNSSEDVIGNLLVGNKEIETYQVTPYYPGPGPNLPSSQYLWHRFFATAVGQYLRIQMTYDDDLMNTLSTHQQTWVLNAMGLYVRQGGKIVF